jgi:hypothetical protein
MPTITSPNLTLTTVNNDVTINVTFIATFTSFERQLAGLGMIFDWHIDILGVDANGHSVLTSFPSTILPVSVGVGPQPIPVNVSKTVTRASLQEDPAVGDNDEIGCNIRIHSQGMPPTFTDDLFTVQRILVG